MRGRQDKLPKIRQMPVPLQTLKTVLDYDALTGDFTWKPRPAGSKHAQGYLTISIGACNVKAHRLAWFYMTGEWPTQIIDHKNGNRSDNRFANLRLATFSQNCMNRKRRSDNKSGYKGVMWMPRNKKWAAYIYHRVPGNSRITKTHIGLFENKEAAFAAVCERREKLHGEFARHE